MPESPWPASKVTWPGRACYTELAPVDRLEPVPRRGNVDFDLIVVGAGPAGSTLAHLMAGQGARVLLLDRARFPRDKPCGGAVTPHAATLMPVDITPVVERTVTKAVFSLRHRWPT